MKNLKTLNTENGAYETTFTRKYEEQKPWERKDPRKILSFIPGTITSIDVKVGQNIVIGENLLMFNAMKMSNQYKSPIAGRVAQINVTVGEAVPKGVVLIEFE